MIVIVVVNYYLCAGWNVVACQAGVLMDKSWGWYWNWGVPPQGLLEHCVQVGQPWQVFLGDCLVAADLSDLLVQAILIDVVQIEGVSC